MADAEHLERLKNDVNAWNEWRAKRRERQQDIPPDLQGTSFAGIDLSGADLQNAILHGADLHGATLYEADLQGADLYGAKLQDAVLQRANLRNANLDRAQFQNAVLKKEADLAYTDLSLPGGLESRQLAGTDLTKAVVPAKWEEAFVQQLADLDASIHTLKQTIFTLLGLCVYSGLVVLAATHTQLITNPGGTVLCSILAQPVRCIMRQGGAGKEDAVSTKIRATIEDLYKVEGKAELVNGEIVVMPPAGDDPSSAGGEIFAHLREYARQSGRGKAYPDGAGFRVNLPHRESFSPDAAYHIGPRTRMRFLDGAPVFAVEVRSEYDYGPAAERAMREKRADYFACGTLVVWDVDLLSADVIKSYRVSAPDTPVIFRRGNTADAEPAVPGWRLAVDELFA